MATNIPQNEASVNQDGSMEYTYISTDKLKYSNTNFQPVEAKPNDKKSDVKMKVRDQHFKAHKDVLTKNSKYFANLFKKQPKEKANDVIVFQQISPRGFSAVLTYFYEGHVTLEPDNVQDILEAIKFFRVEWIKSVCSDFLVRHLSIQNYRKVTVLAEKYALGNLTGSIFHFLGKNITSLTEHENFFQNFSHDLLYQFLRQNVYIDAPEFFLMETVIKWVQTDLKTRQDKLLPLLKEIRFPAMEPEELDEIPDKALKFPQIQKAIQEARDFVYDVSSQSLKADGRFLPRGSTPCVAMMSFSPERNVIMYKDFLNPAGGCCEELGDVGLEVEYDYTSQTSLGNFLYACGGYDAKFQSTNRMFRFDPRSRSWTELVPMQHARVSHAICSSDYNMFVVGGVNQTRSAESSGAEPSSPDVDPHNADSEMILSSVEMYDPKENAWTSLPNFPKACFDQAACHLHHSIFVTGGRSAVATDDTPLKSLHSLALGSEEWRELTPMNVPKQGHSMTALKEKIYAMGGYTSVDNSAEFYDCQAVESYDPETNQWTNMKPAPESFGHIQKFVAIFNNQFYVVGGVYFNRNLHKYDPAQDEWEEGVVVGADINRVVTLKVAYPY